MIASAEDPPQVADQFDAHLVWMDKIAMKPGRGYWLKLGTRTVTATVASKAIVATSRRPRPKESWL